MRKLTVCSRSWITGLCALIVSCLMPSLSFAQSMFPHGNDAGAPIVAAFTLAAPTATRTIDGAAQPIDGAARSMFSAFERTAATTATAVDADRSAEQAGTQTCPPNCTISPGASVSVVFDPTSPRTETGYRMYIDNVKVGNDIAVSAGASVTANAIVLPVAAGSHTLKVSAFNPASTPSEVFSDPLSFSIVIPPPSAPGKPTNLRIVLVITQAANGTIKVDVVAVEPSTGKPPKK
jgi:hypothetical protein